MTRLLSSIVAIPLLMSLLACATPEPGKDEVGASQSEALTGSRLARQPGNGQSVKVIGARATADAMRSKLENRPQSQ